MAGPHQSHSDGANAKPTSHKHGSTPDSQRQTETLGYAFKKKTTKKNNNNSNKTRQALVWCSQGANTQVAASNVRIPPRFSGDVGLFNQARIPNLKNQYRAFHPPHLSIACLMVTELWLTWLHYLQVEDLCNSATCMLFFGIPSRLRGMMFYPQHVKAILGCSRNACKQSKTHKNLWPYLNSATPRILCIIIVQPRPACANLHEMRHAWSALFQTKKSQGPAICWRIKIVLANG